MPSVTMDGGRFSIRVSYETSQDIASNSSTVRVTKVEVRSNIGDDETCWLSGEVRIQGKQAVWLELTGSVQCAAVLGSGFTGKGERWPGWHGRTVQVAHRDDGTQNLNIGVDIDVYATNAVVMGGVYQSVSRSLPTIPRAAGILAQGVTLGTPMDITLNRVGDLRNTLRWQCGESSGTIASNSAETAFTWTPPEDLAWQAVNSASAEVVLTVVSYSGSTPAGSRTITVYCPVPQQLVPTLSAAAEDAMGYAARFGGYIQNKSRVRIRTQAEGICGSGIRAVTVDFGGLSAKGADVSFVPVSVGEIPVRITVEDTRGRTASQTLKVNVQAYSSPRVEIQSLDRCDPEGSLQRDGGYAKVVFSGSLTGLNGKNLAQYTLRRCVRGSSQWTDIPMSALENLLTPNRAEFVFPASIDQDYECWVLLKDAFETVQSGQAALSVAFALLDFNRSNKAVGIGRRAGHANTLDVGLEMRLHGHRITDLADPTDDRDALPLQWLAKLYPVGAIYLSASDECVPQVLFGGTWEKIEGRFLLAAGADYPLGSTGGEAAHTLTAEELPAHKHGQRMAGGFMVDEDASGTRKTGTIPQAVDDGWYEHHEPQVYTDDTGGSGAHNNMPPYLAVNMWLRTA